MPDLPPFIQLMHLYEDTFRDSLNYLTLDPKLYPKAEEVIRGALQRGRPLSDAQFSRELGLRPPRPGSLI